MDREVDIGSIAATVHSLDDLARVLRRLRDTAYQRGLKARSVREIARKIQRSTSTIQPYLSGQRLCPQDVYEDILRALGVPADQLGPWRAAWERIADAQAEPRPSGKRGSQPIHSTEVYRYRLKGLPHGDAIIGIVTGDIRRIHFIDVWINPENTEMKMARVEEFSISAVIRFEGSVYNEASRTTSDLIADELAEKASGRTPLAPNAVIVTGAGRLLSSNGVLHIVHVAAVQGEPGEGYRQVRGIGRGLLNALGEVDRLNATDGPVRSVLVPLLGTGVGGGDPQATVSALTGAAVDYLTQAQPSIVDGQPRVREVYFLAYTESELALYRTEFDRFPRLCYDASS
jgi:O-acetyl-ADP-ribose deacetylase (regulator of RNase III)